MNRYLQSSKCQNRNNRYFDEIPFLNVKALMCETLILDKKEYTVSLNKIRIRTTINMSNDALFSRNPFGIYTD